jgi:hypothetical protein
MNSRYRNPIIVGVLLLILVAGGIYLFKSRQNDYGFSQISDLKTEPKEGEVVVLGTIDCLPASSPIEDCIKSIKGDDGKVYSMNTVKLNGIENTFKKGDKVRAVGVYQEANTGRDESAIFQYDGVLVIRLLQKR